MPVREPEKSGTVVIRRCAAGRAARNVAVVCLLAAAFPAPAPAGVIPDPEALAELQREGRSLATYLGAIAAGRGRLAAQGAHMVTPDHEVLMEGRGWVRIAYLKDATASSPHRDAVIVAQVEYDPTSGEAGALSSMLPPRQAPATTISFARAIQAARTAVKARAGTHPPFDATVQREKDGTFTVYLLPAAVEPGTVRMGADFRVRVARSGRQATAVEPLHASEPVTLQLAGRPAGEPTLHIHAGDDQPTVTDVARVVQFPALGPHLVITPSSLFRIESDGRIVYLGPNPTAPVPPGPGGTP